jgi:hypothetical protein
LLALVLLAACSAKGAELCDVSTDAKLGAVYKRATGNALPKECVARSTSFPGLVTVGAFANDRGCRWREIVYGCDVGKADIGARAMAAAGWGGADAEKRKQLVLAWVRDVHHDSPLDAEPEAGVFAKHGKTFSAPAAEAKDGGVLLHYWTIEPAGMRAETRYSAVEVQFAASGQVLTTKHVDDMTVPITPAE